MQMSKRNELLIHFQESLKELTADVAESYTVTDEIVFTSEEIQNALKAVALTYHGGTGEK